MPDTAVAPPPRTGGGSGGSGIGQLLRDPDHYEEINVIGNGKLNFAQTLLVKNPVKTLTRILTSAI